MVIIYKCKLREIRDLCGMTQAQLADIVGVSRQTINNIETGSYKPKLLLAQSIAIVLNKTIEEIFFDK